MEERETAVKFRSPISPSGSLGSDPCMRHPKQAVGAMRANKINAPGCAWSSCAERAGLRIRSAAFCNQFSATQKLRAFSQSKRTCQAMSQENTSLRPGSREAARYVLLVAANSRPEASRHLSIPGDSHLPLLAAMRSPTPPCGATACSRTILFAPATTVSSAATAPSSPPSSSAPSVLRFSSMA